jgi:hypothetical protein
MTKAGLELMIKAGMTEELWASLPGQEEQSPSSVNSIQRLKAVKLMCYSCDGFLIFVYESRDCQCPRGMLYPRYSRRCELTMSL